MPTQARAIRCCHKDRQYSTDRTQAVQRRRENQQYSADRARAIRHWPEYEPQIALKCMRCSRNIESVPQTALKCMATAHKGSLKQPQAAKKRVKVLSEAVFSKKHPNNPAQHIHFKAKCGGQAPSWRSDSLLASKFLLGDRALLTSKLLRWPSSLLAVSLPDGRSPVPSGRQALFGLFWRLAPLGEQSPSWRSSSSGGRASLSDRSLLADRSPRARYARSHRRASADPLAATLQHCRPSAHQANMSV